MLYVIGITNVNPLKYDLLFERMLNTERDSLPDIDEDFDFLRRSEVIEYITQKYGSDHVAQIGTYTTLSSKIVLKDVGRILGIDHTYINDLNKELPSHNGKVMDLADAVEEIPSFQKASELHPELFELALDLQSMPRGAGVHACGLQISPLKLNNNIPLMRSKESTAVTQYEGPVLENLG